MKLKLKPKNFSEELKAEFPPDECLGAAVCYNETNTILIWFFMKDWM